MIKIKNKLSLKIILVFIFLLFFIYFLTTNKIFSLGDRCPDTVKNVKIFDLSLVVNDLIEAKAYYKILPEKSNNFVFDETKSCTLSFSKMFVHGSYSNLDNSIPKYEYTKFDDFNTWEKYLSDRFEKNDYVTNVFYVKSEKGLTTLDEVYQE